MNADDKRLLYAISESEPASFADISFRTRKETIFLGFKLDDLQHRGFIRLRDGKFSLAKGVKESLLQ
jgi:predicted transcriptional regulator